MLIGVFKSNQKLISILVVVLTIVLWIPSFWHSGSIITYRSSLFYFIDVINDIPILNFLISVVLLCFQGLYLNYIINEFKLVKSNTHLGALFFVLLNGMSSSLLVFNPVMLVNTFVLIILHQLFKLYNKKQTYTILFNTGLLVAIGSLFYFPIIILFPFVWFVLLYIGTPKWRGFIISIIGLIVPFIFYSTYYFLIGEVFVLNELLRIKNVFFVGETAFPFEKDFNHYYYLYILMAIGLVSLIKMGYTIQKNVLRVRKFKVVILIMIFIFSMMNLFNEYDYLATYILISLPLSIFLADYFNELKRRWLAELLFLCLLGVGFLSYFS